MEVGQIPRADYASQKAAHWIQLVVKKLQIEKPFNASNGAGCVPTFIRFPTLTSK